MSVRLRLIYEKRGGACFVPHVALAALFTRSALRAGLPLSMTQGFSPHPKMSFGPELPAGVVALNEPVDIWLEEPRDYLAGRLNAAMPEGFRVVSAGMVAEDAPKLGTVCRAALYWIRGTGAMKSPALLEASKKHYGDAVLDAEAERDIEENGRAEWLSLTLSNPAQNAVGGWVKAMIADGSVEGWQDLNIVRAAIGEWDERGGVRVLV